MQLTRLALALAVTSLAAGAGEVRAGEPAALRLEWSAPAGCPGAEEVRALTVGVLGREIGGDGAAVTRVRGQVRKVEGGFRLTIETRSASGTDVRRLEDRRCAVLAEAAAVIAAAAIDGTSGGAGAAGAAGTGVSGGTGEVSGGTGGEGVSGGTGEVVGGTGGTGVSGGTGEVSGGTGEMSGGTGGAVVSEGTGEVAGGTGGVARGTGGVPTLIPVMPATDARLAPGTGAARGGLRPAVAPRGEPVSEDEALREVREAAGRDAPAPVRRVRIGVRVSGLFDLGSTPGATGGLALAGAVIGRRWRVELSGLWIAARTGARPDPAIDLRARVGLLAAGLRGCGVPGWRALEFPLCGGFEAGALRGAGVGTALRETRTDALPWLAVTAGPGLVWSPVARVGLGLAIDLVVPVLPRRFGVSGFGDVYSGDRVAGRVSVGLELRFR